MNKIVKYSIVFVVLSLALSACLLSAAAGPTLTVGQVTAEAGDTVQVTVDISNNSGFAYLSFAGPKLSYDSEYLTLESASNNVAAFNFTNGAKQMFWDAAENYTGNGTLVTLTFSVSEEAPAGDYPISVNVHESYDIDVEDVAWTVVAGKITVKESETIPSVGETMSGYNLTMQGSEGGDIGVNLNFSANEALRGDAEAYVKVLYKGEETKYMLSTLTFDGEGNTRLTTYVPAKEMANDITAIVYNGAGECGASYTYSVKSYAEYILEHSGEYDAKLVSMVKATLNYGAYAQKYFGYNTEKLANSSLSAADGQGAIDAVTSIDVADPVYNGTVSAAGLAKHSVSIVLGSETTVKHYITLAEGQNISSFMFQLGGATVTPVAEGERYCITISDIEAADLDSGTMLQVICMNPFGMYNVTYSAMNYVEAMFNNCKDKAEYTDLCNLLKALYLYNDAANTYFGK